MGGPKGHKQIQPTREKIVLEITMGNCKMNYGNDKKNKKEKRQIKKNDLFAFCRSCKQTITNDYRSKFDQRYCADCL